MCIKCDICRKDYSNSNAKGGLLFDKTKVCPACTPKLKVSIKHHQQERWIIAEALADEKFTDFIKRVA